MKRPIAPVWGASCVLGLFACAGTSKPSTVSTPPPGEAPAPVAAAPAPRPKPATRSGYDQPPPHILEAMHAPAPPYPVLSPTRDRILLVSWVRYPPITQVGEPFLKLAGVRVEPRTRRKHDTPGGYGIAPCAQTLALVDVASSKETAIALPPESCIDSIKWSADGKQFAFRNTTDAVELWVGDGATGKLRRLGDVRLNPMLGSSHTWLADQRTLLVKLVPAGAAAPPEDSLVQFGPGIQESDGKSGESSTYETRDTLKNRHDEDLFDYYAASQLALVDSATGKVTVLGKPAVMSEVTPAPDGAHFLVRSIHKPYSYVTTFSRFPQDVEVWDRQGQVTTLAKLPLAERVPIHGEPLGPRDHEWRPTEPATLVWAEALDQGDWNVNVPNRDKVMMQRAPFTEPAVEIARTVQRFAGLHWTEQREVALLREYDHNKHWNKTFIADVDKPAIDPKPVWDMSSDEQYLDPGWPVYEVLPSGHQVVRKDGDAIYLEGKGASPAGARPFLDRFDLRARKATRLFRSEPTALEWFMDFSDDAGKSFLTWHQSPGDPPNAMLRTLGDAMPSAAAGEASFASARRAVTHVPDPQPMARGIKKRLVKYKRKDGVDLSFTLYTPPDYKEGTRVPAILYAYPLDYASATQAGQVSGTDQTFTLVDDYQLLLLSGYAIIDQAAFPIVGDPRNAYDTYLEQLVDDARAAVDKAVELGVVDRERIGVTGHSHGALMAANLMAHTDLFRAGVSTSGAYNKTLTPFGFQNERRSVWKAQSVYLKVSPFFFADKIKLPLLIVHGEDDANPGTTPLQSTKLYEAIRGNGGITRLVLLPHEPHWYTAMESNEQLAYEELRWFDKYVKNAPSRDRPSKAPGSPAIRNKK